MTSAEREELLLAAATPDFEFKQYSTYPPLQTTLVNGPAGSQVPIPLTGATQVELAMRSTTAVPQVLVTGLMAFSASPTGGYAAYTWGPSDTAIADTYNAEFRIAWSAGGIEKVPNGNYYRTIRINPDLGEK